MASFRTWLAKARDSDDEWRASQPERRYANVWDFLGNTTPPAGLTDYNSISPDAALTASNAVYACVTLLADVVGSLPLHLYRKTPQGRERIDSSTMDRALRGRGYPGSLARLLGEVPNPEMTAQEVWTNAVGSCALNGNAYLEVMRGVDGRPSALWPLRADRMRVTREGGELRYYYRLNAGEVEIPEVMHLRLFGTDGIMGLSPITVASRTLSAEKGSQEFADNWYASGANPSAIVTIPKAPDGRFKERVKTYRRALQGLYGGPANAGKIAVVEEGIDWKQLNVTQKDMQYVESRKFGVEEIARIFRVPGYAIGLVEPGEVSYASVEQRNLHFLSYTLRPIFSRIENACNRDLGLVPGERLLSDESLYAEFQTADLLRADLKTRFDAYAVGTQWGFVTRADVRGWENLPPIAGLEEPLTPVNMVAGEPPTVQDTAPDSLPAGGQ